MAASIGAIAYGAVAAAGVTLFLIGTPAQRPSAVAASMPPADPAAASVSAAGVTLTSVSVALPSSDQLFPDHPGVDVINDNCLACHSAEMVLDQPSLGRTQWQAEVTKMRTTFKAPIDDADAAAIVGYLVRIKGR